MYGMVGDELGIVGNVCNSRGNAVVLFLGSLGFLELNP